jgi:hypothetical protein
MKLVTGKLFPSKLNPVTLHENLRKLEYEFEESPLWQLTLQNAVWQTDHIAYRFAAPAYDSENVVSYFVSALTRIMQSEPATNLGLRGQFILTVETDEGPVVTRVTVKDGEVSYEQAELIWPSEPITMDRHA